MISLKRLLVENPDTVYYKKKTYNYSTEANKCAFLVYKDEKTNKNTVFGYSAVKKEFLCDDLDVLKEIDELDKAPDIQYRSDRDQPDYWAQKVLRELNNGNNGGGHLQLENLLKGIGRIDYDAPLLRGRIFEVDDDPAAPIASNLDIRIESAIPRGKAIIVSFWTSNLSKLVPFKKKYEYAIEFNGYNPKEVLYEPGSKFYTYNELYGIDEPNKQPTQTKPRSNDNEAGKYFTIGDKVRVKGFNIVGDVIAIKGDDVTIAITHSDVNGVTVDSERTFKYFMFEPDNKPVGISLEKVIDDKTQEFVEKRGKLHTTGAKFTPAEKANLEREVDSLEIEIKILNDLSDNGVKKYTDNVKSVVAASVSRKLHAKEKEKLDRYSLIAQAEKQYGMPIAQIRQRYRGVPLDQLVKKESIYKRLLKALLG